MLADSMLHRPQALFAVGEKQSFQGGGDGWEALRMSGYPNVQCFSSRFPIHLGARFSRRTTSIKPTIA